MKSLTTLLHTFPALFIILLFTCISSVIAQTGSTSSRQTKFVPTHYFIFGDKFSGVNYLSQILNTSSASLPLQECKSIVINRKNNKKKDESTSTTSSSWRYGFFTFNDLKKRLDCDINKTLFILTVRDVRSMVCSVAKRKFQSSNVEKLQQMHVNGLIVHRWAEEDTLLDLNGSATLSRYKVYNYLQMRTNKLKFHYSILSRVKHGFISRYEDFHSNPSYEVKRILRGRGIKVGSISDNKINNIIQTKDEKDSETSCFKLFTPALYSKTIKKLDQRMERKIGYPLALNKTLERPQSFSLRAWNVLMNTLWWTIIPTLIILSLFYVYLFWREISRQYAIYCKKRRSRYEYAYKFQNRPKIKPMVVGRMKHSHYQQY